MPGWPLSLVFLRSFPLLGLWVVTFPDFSQCRLGDQDIRKGEVAHRRNMDSHTQIAWSSSVANREAQGGRRET